MIVTINGRKRRFDVPPMTRLLEVLRENCGLTGTKEGCGEGECGACTVLIDGVAVDSCLVPVVHASGCEVVTIEGAAAKRSGKALQNAFVEHGGAQCGICTPGMIMAALPLKAGASREEIKTALAGNLCRCTGYLSIFQSVEAALLPLPSQVKKTRGLPKKRGPASRVALRRAGPRARRR
jgi:carbon-monoxide dehydrogenase small subunit